MSAAGLARPCGHMFGVGQRSIANHGTGAAENTSSEVERSASTCEWATKVGEWATKVGESPRARGPVGAVWGRVGTLLGRHRGDSDPPGATRGADLGPTGRVHAGPTLARTSGGTGGRLAAGRVATRCGESRPGRVPLGGASGSSPLPCAPPLPVRPLPRLRASLQPSDSRALGNPIYNPPYEVGAPKRQASPWTSFISDPLRGR
jgi:hypothetical protein